MPSARPPRDNRRTGRTGSDLHSAYQRTVDSLAAAPPRSPPSESLRRRPWVSRGLIRAGLAVAMVLAIMSGVSLWSVYQASQQVPEFYVQALAAPRETQAAAGQELEKQALSLNSQVRRSGQWEARFTQDQINGWLAVDLPTKFPGSLPRGVSEPRVAVAQGQIQLAVKWQQGSTSAVLSASGEVYLTEEPNQVAVRILSVRAGVLPVPLARFLDEIANRAASSGLPLEWTEIEGDPVALITLPLEREEFRGKQLLVEELRLEEDAIVVAGKTDDGSLMTIQPSVSETRQR
jgi:cytochrome c-type biogenesis protein CcmE